VQAILGHENLSQTTTYLNATRIGLHESMRRFDDARGKPAVSVAQMEGAVAAHHEKESPATPLVN
jgi:hypothetical protein